jgi:hypothetical protein
MRILYVLMLFAAVTSAEIESGSERQYLRRTNDLESEDSPEPEPPVLEPATGGSEDGGIFKIQSEPETDVAAPETEAPAGAAEIEEPAVEAAERQWAEVQVVAAASAADEDAVEREGLTSEQPLFRNEGGGWTQIGGEQTALGPKEDKKGLTREGSHCDTAMIPSKVLELLGQPSSGSLPLPSSWSAIFSSASLLHPRTSKVSLVKASPFPTTLLMCRSLLFYFAVQMTLNKEIDEESDKRLHSAEVSILGTLQDDAGDSGNGDDKNDSSMPSPWAVWSRSMKYPWNLKTDSNADATYGVLAASVSISRTEDGNEIPQFEIDFSGVTKRATFYDIIYAYKTKESLGVQNSDTIEYLLPCLPVTVRTHIVKPEDSEADQTNHQERCKTFVVYDKNHTVIGRTVTPRLTNPVSWS